MKLINNEKPLHKISRNNWLWAAGAAAGVTLAVYSICVSLKKSKEIVSNKEEQENE